MVGCGLGEWVRGCGWVGVVLGAWVESSECVGVGLGVGSGGWVGFGV